MDHEEKGISGVRSACSGADRSTDVTLAGRANIYNVSESICAVHFWCGLNPLVHFGTTHRFISLFKV